MPATNHIPRPKNAFISFRTDYISKIPRTVERDHKVLSALAGAAWRNLDPATKAEWYAKADEEKRRHREAYPGYRFDPMPKKETMKRRSRRKGPQEEARCQRIVNLIASGKSGEDLATEVHRLDEQTNYKPNGEPLTPPLQRSRGQSKRPNRNGTPSTPSVPSPISSMTASPIEADQSLFLDPLPQPSNVYMSAPPHVPHCDAHWAPELSLPAGFDLFPPAIPTTWSQYPAPYPVVPQVHVAPVPDQVQVYPPTMDTETFLQALGFTNEHLPAQFLSALAVDAPQVPSSLQGWNLAP